jgi:diacylglycerol kinase (ATP)
MPDWVAIRNPVSGRSRLAKRWPSIESQIRNVIGDGVVWDTAGSGDATRLATRAVGAGAELVIAVGGDGTITQVANGLIGSRAKLAMIPAGTGNDLCRTLGIGGSIESALEALAGNRTIQMDVGHWTTDRSCGYFLNVAGMGFDAAVAARINSGFRFLRGTSAYVAATALTLVRYRAMPLRLQIDGIENSEKIMLAAVANARCYGGGMKIAPTASVTDGLLDIVLVRHIGKLAFLRSFPKVFKGSHLQHHAVGHTQGKCIRLEPESEASLLIDGELTPCRWAELRVMPAALNVIVF